MIISELHETYSNSTGAFAKSYLPCNDELISQIDKYCRACAIFLWFKFGTNVDVCVEAINQIYSEGQSSPGYAREHIETAMSRLSEREFSMPVPKFFNSIISYDKKKNSDYSRRLAYCFQLLDISFALIDGKVEAKEAELIKLMQKNLIEACDSNGIKHYAYEIDPFDFVDGEEEEGLIVTAIKLDDITKNPLVRTEQKETKAASERAVSSKEKDPIEALYSMIGLTRTKEEVQEIIDFAKVQKERENSGLPVSSVSYHLVFTGRPGTGKTTVARLIARIYKDLGIISKEELVECSAKDLVAGYVGQTAIKTGEVIQKALGGVLFIDEAYTLVDKNGQGYGQEAIDTLLKEMEDHRDNLAVIVAGYDDLMKGFIESNPGLKSRFNRYIHFDDYTPNEMEEIFKQLCEKNAYSLDNEAEESIKEYFEKICDSDDDSFANARTVRNLFEKIISKQASRIAKITEKTPAVLSAILKEDVIECTGAEEKEESLEDVMREFNALIGLETVKEEISDLIYIVQNQQKRKAQGLKVPSLSLHLVFMGNPGTGKTTVARCIARLYKCLGLLSKGQMVETDRSGLVAGYVGQTAIKTQDVIDSAVGGVLFIDEAYTLSGGGENDFGQESIDTLLKAMEDKRDDLVVIVAGYDDLMDDFIHSNPGLESRFNRYIHFEDYSPEQMYEIFNSLCENNQYILTDAATNEIKKYFSSVDISEFGNGRGVRNTFEKVLTQQAKRTEMDDDPNVDLSMITETDIQKAVGRN